MVYSVRVKILRQLGRSALALVAALLAFNVVWIAGIAALSGHNLLDEDAHALGTAGQMAIIVVFAVAALVGGYVAALVAGTAKLIHAIAFATLVFVDALLTDAFTSKYTFTAAEAALFGVLALGGGVLCVRITRTLRARSRKSKA